MEKQNKDTFQKPAQTIIISQPNKPREEEQITKELPYKTYLEDKEQNLEFQLRFSEKLLETFNNRRTAVDARATIVCTIGLALLGFLLTQGADVFKSPSINVRYILLILVIIPTFISVLYSLSLISPFRRPKKERNFEIHSLTWFRLIVNYSLTEYQSEIKSLSKTEVLDQSIKQVFELSKLLTSRYKRLIRACQALGIAILLLFISLLATYVPIIIYGETK